MNRKLLLSAAALFALASATAGCGSKCGPDTCSGCCDASGICQPGQSASACGKLGAACAICAGAQTCQFAVCAFPGGGNGNGGNSGNTSTTSSGSSSTTSSSSGSSTTSGSTSTSSSSGGTTSSTGASTGSTGSTSTSSSTGTTTGSTGSTGSTSSTTTSSSTTTTTSGSGSTTSTSGSSGTTGVATFCSAGPTKTTVVNGGVGDPCTGSQTDGGPEQQGNCQAGQVCKVLYANETTTRCTVQDCTVTACPTIAGCFYTDSTNTATQCLPGGYNDGTGCPSGLVPADVTTPDPSDVTDYCAPPCTSSTDCNGTGTAQYACVNGTCKCTNTATDCINGAICDTASGACIFACTGNATCDALTTSLGSNVGCCLQYGGKDFCDVAATP